jgi:hypothetical protein
MVQPNLIQTKADWHKYLDRALVETQEIAKADPNWRPIKSVREQLEFMRDTIASRGKPSPEEAARVNVGPLAVRNFDDAKPEYAHWLMALDYGFRHWDTLG